MSLEQLVVYAFVVSYRDGAGVDQSDRFATRQQAQARAYYLRARGRVCMVRPA